LNNTGPFNSIAETYDRWYDEAEGAAIFAAELACLQAAVPELHGQWLEVGVGTGRFAHALGVANGIDPAPSMLALAARRNIRTTIGTAEELPYAADSFDGVVMVAALCFVENAPRALDECYRVTRPGGTLLLGHIPSDAPWGRSYTRKAAAGHPVYSHARFTTVVAVLAMAHRAGFQLQTAVSGLFWPPGSPPETPPQVKPGVLAGAGFVALALGHSVT